MVLCNREGRFNAVALEIGVGETGDNKLATVVARYSLREQIHDDGTAVDITAENLEITGYHYLEKTVKDAQNQIKRDGAGRTETTLNERAIKDLRDSFGWDGKEPFWLQDHQAELPMVQVTTGWETYTRKDGNQTTIMKLKWLNPLGSTGGAPDIPKTNDAERRALSARLGGKLRAMNGGSPAAMPAKPAPPNGTTTPPSVKTPPARKAPLRRRTVPLCASLLSFTSMRPTSFRMRGST